MDFRQQVTIKTINRKYNNMKTLQYYKPGTRSVRRSYTWIFSLQRFSSSFKSLYIFPAACKDVTNFKSREKRFDLFSELKQK